MDIGVAGRVEQLLFPPGEPNEVLTLMARLEAEDGGWINLSPVPEEDADGPVGSGRRQWLPHLFDLLLDAGPDIPVGTWVPPRRAQGKGRGVATTSIGLQHPSGQRALDRLQRAGIDPPPGWRLVQDHPRRGLVFSAPVGADHRATLEWLIRAGDFLSVGPRAASWLATVHLRQ
jgi:hypothetical protein